MDPSSTKYSASDRPGDDVCITGIAGYFPNSYSVKHLAENLFNKVDLISDDERRWTKSHPEIPQRTGKVYNVEKFDASFFGVDFKQAHALNPLVRLVLERVYECLIDAGINPSELRNTNTGVFTGACISENEKEWMYEKAQISCIGPSSFSHSAVANQVSEWLQLKGPSYTVDTACSSSLYALDHAYKALRDGLCDMAIVTGLNLCLHPSMSLLFYRMGILSPDGRCKTFDARANGYARSESIVACLLQKQKDSRRVHAKLVHTKTNCDGYKVQGITYPAGHIQKLLLEQFYAECGISPSTIEFMEAHGTGTTVGDPEEVGAIDDIFCKDRKEPLLIGSIKSNLGHSEASSGLNSVAKACIAYNSGFLPPNINFESPRKECPSLMEGRLRVVTEKMPWNKGRFALSSFGFGGANAHVVLENYPKKKVNNGLPSDGIPRLVCVSGRTESAVVRIVEDLASRSVDQDEVRLWHAIHERDIPAHHYRGFVLLDSISAKTIPLAQEIVCNSHKWKKRPVWFKYTDLSTCWPAVAKQCMILSGFSKAFNKCSSVLKSKGLDLMKLLNGDFSRQNEFAIVGAATVHIGLTDVLKAVGIEPDYVISYDEGFAAYANGQSTIDEVILSAYKTNMVIRNSGTISRQSKVFPTNALMSKSDTVLEIGPHEDLKNVYDKVLIPLIGENRYFVKTVLTAIGRVFLKGSNPRLANIYPTISFPVAQGTPMMSHLVEWDHSDDWTVTDYREFTIKKIPFGQETVTLFMADDQIDYLKGHTIDDRIIFPATGYLQLVWESYSSMTSRLYTKNSVVFEEVYFLRPTNLPKEGVLEFTITVHEESGKFEVTENNMSIVTGKIRDLLDTDTENKKRSFNSLKSLLSRSNEDEPIEILNTKDFYKELNIRGYQYKGLFRGVLSCSVDGTHGTLSWDHNWVTFLDTMLQVKIVSQDTRSLYVPTRIEKIIIDTDKHNQILEEFERNNIHTNMSIDFESIHEIDMTRAGGVEVRGIHVSAISKKPPRGIPVLESNKFIANFCEMQMPILDLLRCNLQLIHENIQTYKFKTIELVDEEYNVNNLQPISQDVADILADLPLIQAEIIILCNETLQMSANITVTNRKITGESNTVLFIGANLLKRRSILQEAVGTLRSECFVLTREKEFNYEYNRELIDIITVFLTETEYFVLLRHKIKPKPTKCIKIDTKDLSFSWIDNVKNELRKEDQKIVLYSENEPVNGLLGLVNCLRKEPGGEAVRGVLVADPAAPAFSAQCELYKEHLEKGLAINVFKDGQWGTYRHMLLEEVGTVSAAHAYVNTATIGDLSSLRYFEGKLSEKLKNNKNSDSIFVHVYCSALNFRDAMIALGRVTVDAVARGRINQDCVQGLEVSGRTLNGSRIMAVCSKGISNLVEVIPSLIWPIPEEWSFQEAATVPVAYLTVYLAMVMIAKVRRGESILIHAGSGGVGQAAINVALHYGLEVFTTVGTPVKRAFIKRLFPQIKDSHIGNSRDTSFEQMIRRETNGEGVDVVLNSLADEKLQASLKCLRRCGRFLEIGKYDITVNTQLEMCFLQKEISVHSIMLDFINDYGAYGIRMDLQKLVHSGIQSGAVRPLTNCSFDKYEIQTSYRYLAAGRHIGKLIIKMREEESSNENIKPSCTTIDAVPRYICNEQHVYVLVGGLGGIGLELADWLVLRGARKFVVSSRRGVTKGYQSLRTRIWKSYGVKLEISTHDVTSESGCEEMLKMAATMGPVKAIFNLAVVLNDAIFQNQTPESFQNSFGPKALTTIHLDKLSRKYCPELRDFVIFSSVSCGRGNAGQTNYGFSNSVMERICEERKKVGLPALAIQWGAIGDVGLVADLQDENVQLEIGGTLQQRITSCLQVLDKFLKQDATIVSSIVVAEKRAANAGFNSIVDVIAQILGISDVKSISQQAPLSEMGMDSVMAVEIKQTLERDYELFLTAQEIRLLTFAKLTELASRDSSENDNTTIDSPRSIESNNNIAAGLGILIKNFGDEKQASKPYVILNPSDKQVHISANEKILFMLPGIESCASTFEFLCSKINIRTCVLQLGLNYDDDLEKTVYRLYKTTKSLLHPGAPFYLLGYSFGSLPILKLAEKLECEGHKGIVICVDGSPEYLKLLVDEYLKFSDDIELQNYIVYHCLNMVCPGYDVDQSLMSKLKVLTSFEDKIKYAIDMAPAKLNYSDEFMYSMAKVTFNRIKMTVDFDSSTMAKINAQIVLLRTKKVSVKKLGNEMYGLDKMSNKTVNVYCINASHSSITESIECAEIINRTLDDFKIHN